MTLRFKIGDKVTFSKDADFVRIMNRSQFGYTFIKQNDVVEMTIVAVDNVFSIIKSDYEVEAELTGVITGRVFLWVNDDEVDAVVDWCFAAEKQDNECKHPRKYRNIVSKTMQFDYCPDCKKEIK